MEYKHSYLGTIIANRIDGGIGGGTIYPSLQEEISSELIEEVLNELRQDPDLKDMFEMVETEFEQIGAEIEITEDNRLENELLQW